MSTIDKSVNRPITKRQARDLTECIKSAAALTWDLIVKAYNERAWAALGYGSWDDYCDAELSGTRLRLPREERSEVVSSLRDSGMSLRAIEAATGVSRPTIIKDLAVAQVVNSLPPEAPGGVTDSTPGQTDRVAAALERARHGSAPATTVITGVDGKTYSKPEKPVEPKAEKMPPSATFGALARKLRDLDRISEACLDIAEQIEFDGDDGAEQFEVASTLSDAVRETVESICGAVTGSAPVSLLMTMSSLPPTAPASSPLKTWYAGRSWEFSGWGELFDAISAGSVQLGTMLATLEQDAYRVGRSVKIPLDEADELRVDLLKLRAALIVLIDIRQDGGR